MRAVNQAHQDNIKLGSHLPMHSGNFTKIVG